MASSCSMANAPRYKDLIEILEQNDEDAASMKNDFIARYPHITIPRADRFRNTCQRIAARYKAVKFTNTEALTAYMDTVWKPRVHNISQGQSIYPEYLEENGLNESMLQLLLDESCEITWEIPNTCPSKKFYSYLHPFLKSSEETKDCTKTQIGQLYCRIDPYISARRFRPDNAFRFVERLVSSKLPADKSKVQNDESESQLDQGIIFNDSGIITDTCVDESTVDTSDPPHACKSYNNWAPDVSLQHHREPSYKRRNVVRRETRTKSKMESLKLKLKMKINELRIARKKMSKSEAMIVKLTEKVTAVTNELNETYKTLQETNNELSSIRKMECKRERAFQLIEGDFCFSESVIDELQDENKKLKELIASMNNELTNPKSTMKPIVTKVGKHYSLPIRRLYYDLLANQVPASKVSSLVKSVVRCFFPDIDASDLQLPKERCTGYMRKEELCTVELAQKAHNFCGQLKSQKPFHLNSDGTTLYQHKIYGVAVNDVVLSLTEVADGSAESAIESIEKELEKVRNVALQLQLPFANSINWTLFSSSTSDSAATQKKFNRLLEERIERDRENFGTYEGSGLDLIRNFCAMHLGVNLRKAFVAAVCAPPKNTGKSHRNTDIDTFVHEFAKEFGSNGTPEYCVGNVKFPDFLNIQLQSSSSDSEYLKQCLCVHLERQIGSRYFVTAANASKALFLAQAALEFLKYNGISEASNKLEKALYLNLQDSSLMSSVKADALMFYFIYADLMTLAKSKELNKSVYDMRVHYLELQHFLEEIEEHAEIVSERYYQVFVSEPLLYSSSSKVNHRLRNTHIWDHLFTSSSFSDNLLSKVSAGATSMKLKLIAYASNQLPGGEFWDPDPDVQEILSTIKPTNDICESILGLNDYLSTAIPNLNQSTRSTLVSVKKNETIKWLQNLPDSTQNDIALMAMKARRQVNAIHKKEQDELQRKRQQLMLQSKKRRDILDRKAAEERQKLSVIHIITSVGELEQAFDEIDHNSSIKKNNEKKRKILREQVAVRKKLLNQKISMTFTQAGKKKPLPVLIAEFKEIVIQNPFSVSSSECSNGEVSNSYDPIELVGRHISHKFISEDNEEVWYEGYIVGYNAATKLHELAYIEEDNFHYDLTEDLCDGDIVFLDESDNI